MLRIIGKTICLFLFVTALVFVLFPLQAEKINITDQLTEQLVVAPDLSITLNVSKNSAVIDEFVPWSVSISYDPRFFEIVTVHPPYVDGKKLQALSDPITKQKKINGKWQNSIQFEGQYFPERAGRIKFLPVTVEYIKKNEGRSISRGASFFSMFYGPPVYKALSKDFILSVHPLHKILNQKDRVVGDFKRIRLVAEKTTLKRGDAITVKFEIEGKGNFHLFRPQLIVDEHIKLYDAGAHKTAYGWSFEYILQPTTVGFYKIVQQPFIYFDTQSRRYKRILTNSLDIEVLEGALAAAIDDDIRLDDLNSAQDGGKSGDKDIIENQKIGVDENRFYISTIRKAAINDRIFSLLIFVLMIAIFIVNIWSKLHELKNYVFSWLQFKYFLITAKKRFNYAFKQGDVQLVYSIFKKFNEEVAMKHFSVKNNSLKKKYQDWMAFYLEVQELKFFNQNYDSATNTFVPKAIVWIDYMRKIG